MAEDTKKDEELGVVQLVIGGAGNVPAVQDEAAEPASAGRPSTGSGRGQGVQSAAKPPPPGAPTDPDEDILDDLPVTPLGVRGEMCFYLDANRQLRKLKDREHGRNALVALFAPRADLLHYYWQRTDRNGNPAGFHADKATDCLINACARRGVIDPDDLLRGSGAWQSDDGALVLHCGDVVIEGGRGERRETVQTPGSIGDHVYPRATALPRPVDPGGAGAGPCGPAAQVLDLLASWRWARQDIAPTLMLGWMGAALLGGALDWRPALWLTGDKGTGKSTLQRVLAHVLGGWLLSVSDVSAAGIWQKLGHASLPVAFDEAEAEEDNRKLVGVVKLMRQSSSGGLVLRGGADHQSTEFVARSAFLFSSILMPSLPAQDISRLAILDLLPFASPGDGGGLPALAADRAALGKLGRGLTRRLLDQWPRFADTLTAYRMAIASEGHAARGADQYGTLLACADLMLSDRPPTGDDLAQWIERVGPMIGSSADTEHDHESMIAHLLSSTADVFKGGQRRSIGELVQVAALRKDADLPSAASEAQQALATYGLRVTEEGNVKYLAIANKHRGLAGIFDGSRWCARSGDQGVWSQAAGRIPGATQSVRRFAGYQARAWLVPLDEILGPPGDDEQGVV